MADAVETTSTLMGRRTQNPQTLLAFHATVLGIWLGAIIGVATSLGFTKAGPNWLLPTVVAVGLMAAMSYVVAVFALSVMNPSKLMLGQVTGDEYVKIQHAVLGDSRSGERVASVIRSEQILVEPSILKASQQSTEVEEEE